MGMDMLPDDGRNILHLQRSVLRENAFQLKRYIRQGTKFMAVVKGQAYGFGIEESVMALEDLCDWFATATVEEAYLVRKHTLKPILVFGWASDEEILRAAASQITLSGISLSYIYHAAHLCANHHTRVDMHIKLDTGFHRMGIDAWESDMDVSQLFPLFTLSGVHMTGMYTHLVFAGSNKEHEKTFTQKQFDRFQAVKKQLSKAGYDCGLCHICNSKATVHEPSLHLDMVRVGAYLFGLASPQECSTIPLRTPFHWKARIVLCRHIEQGEGVGYGHDFIAPKPTRIAVVAAGFADGFRRSLSLYPQVYLLCKGQRVTMVGKICMDMLMIDVTKYPQIQEGDYVTLLGKDGQDEVSAYTLGKLLSSTAGELTTGISDRVIRHYL